MAASLRLSVSQCLRAALLWLLLTWAQCLEMTCIEVKKSYVAKGFDETEMPFYAVSGENLEICPQGQSCCSRSMEDKLTSLSRKEHNRQLEESFKLLKTVFASRTQKFDSE
ncbi:hypothetical protein V1264_010302 [Littorina saxatilis]|uniref:Uncharacterized protein n=1 Tax=Littorina saxatilis TaxID=31220 RepID=A0AAN9AP32_9CAEN